MPEPTMPEPLLGAVRRSPDGRVLAVLWPSPPHPARWMVTDQWGSCGYETDEVVAGWPTVGAVPYSPAAGFPFPGSPESASAPQQEEPLLDPDCDRCDGSGLDPDTYTAHDGPRGTGYRPTSCLDCRPPQDGGEP